MNNLEANDLRSFLQDRCNGNIELYEKMRSYRRLGIELLQSADEGDKGGLYGLNSCLDEWLEPLGRLIDNYELLLKALEKPSIPEELEHAVNSILRGLSSDEPSLKKSRSYIVAGLKMQGFNDREATFIATDIESAVFDVYDILEAKYLVEKEN